MTNPMRYIPYPETFTKSAPIFTNCECVNVVNIKKKMPGQVENRGLRQSVNVCRRGRSQRSHVHGGAHGADEYRHRLCYQLLGSYPKQ
jgi:hypothetical protein